MDSVSDLLEIAGEDDSLLSGVNNSTSANLFSCSPLVSIRSRPPQTAQPVERIETTSVVSEDLNSSPKCSGPEASETQQSQQKKRKKKFGGFNLRKSLAWDRAFFTEQGVLNPTELSMISGTATPNSKSNLEVIDEEELATTSTVLQQIEENLFRHSSGGVSIRAKKIGAVSGLSPKPGASVKRTPPVASLGKRKVLATNNVGNKYKRSAIPKAVPSSSYPCHCLFRCLLLTVSFVKKNLMGKNVEILTMHIVNNQLSQEESREKKRRKNLTLTQTVSEWSLFTVCAGIELISGPKSNVSANATTTRSGMLSSSSSKRNQNAHPGLSKNPAPSIPSLSKNPSPSIPRLSKNPTPSIPSLSKNPTPSIPSLSKNPTPSIPSLSKNPTPSIPRLSKNPTYVPSIPKVDTADKCSVSRTLTKQAGKLLDNSVSVPRPPSSMHQTGTIKSSGLRKPSPSIGFFSQVKASGSHSLQKSSIPCKPSESNIPKLRKLETVSVKEARPKIVKGAAKNTKELSLSDVQSEAIMQIDNKQMAGVEVECDSSSFEIVSKQAEVENILDDVILKSQEQGELHENKIISSKENMALPTHGKEFLRKSQTHEQLEKEADHDLGNKLYDVPSNVDRSLYQEPQSMLNPIMQRTSNTVQNASGQDEGDQIKGPSGDVPTFKESLILQEEHRTSFKDGRHSGEFKGDNNVKSALLNSSLDDFSKTVPEGSKHGTPCKNTEQVNYGAGEFGKYGRDAQGHLLNDSLTINCKKTTQSNLEAVSLQLQADQPMTLNPSGVKENGPEKENISNMNCSQHVHVMTLFSKGSPEKSILGINGASENESKIIEIKLPVNDQSGFIPRSPMDKECDQVIDSKAVHDRTPEFELDRLSEDCITVSTSSMADDNNINEDSHLPGFQKPSAVVTVNSQDVHLDNDFLPAVIVSPTELKDQNLVEDAFEDCGFHSIEHNATNHHIEDMLAELLQINGAEDGNCDVDENVELLQINDVDEKVEVLQIIDGEDGNHDVDEKVEFLQINGAEDGNHDVDEKVELLQINGAEDGNYDVDEKVELLQINGAEEVSEDSCLLSEESKLLASDNPTFIETIPQDSSIEVSEDSCLLSEKSKLLASDNPAFIETIPQGNEVSSANSESFSDVAVTTVFENDKSPNTDMPNQTEDNIDFLEDNSKKIHLEIDASKTKQEVPIAKPPLNVAPFTEEWFAAIEAAGEAKLLNSDMLVNKDGNQDMDEKVELLGISGAEEGSLDISPSVDIKDMDEKVELLRINGADEGNEVSSENSESFSDVAVTTVFENDKSPNTDSLSQTNHNRKTIHLKIDATKTKQEVPIVAPPLNVAPFTEEWLAAIEAAGENILTMKSGAVQNSPPDKVQNEPNPWSPVKKNQEIGPFDCTKITKHNLLSSDPS
ncbi:unnamed protein product [Vicia faba]|uniref:Uncharacterized protein n=1 Tax=Vicia faba TaxID=3906 RepID=A0AAV1B2G7_VICFA|nr:unnamed protein product [Vicia faba]